MIDVVKVLAVPLLALSLVACGPDSTPVAQAMQEVTDLSGTSWQVEDIDAGGIIDNSQVTIEIQDPTQIAGSGGCNRYFGSLDLALETFRASIAGSTMKACAPALEDQERRFLKALTDARRFSADDTVLQLFDEQGRARIRAVAAGGNPEPVAPPADAVAPDAAAETRFDCSDGLSTSMSFVGPETLRLTLPDGPHLLQRQPSASGTKYTGDGILFWNKGAEALLDIGGVEHHCVRAGYQSNNKNNPSGEEQ